MMSSFLLSVLLDIQVIFIVTDKFMMEQTAEYEIGRRHLANMMGESPDTFTDKDIDVISN